MMNNSGTAGLFPDETHRRRSHQPAVTNPRPRWSLLWPTAAAFAIAVFTFSPSVLAQLKTVIGPDGRPYQIYDEDNDGWPDAWSPSHTVTHRDKSLDSDGDGVTDYFELLMGRDPYVKEELLREPTTTEIAEAERNAAAARAAAQKEWETKLAEAAPHRRELIAPERRANEAMDQARDAEFTALRQQAAQSLLDQPAKDRALDALAKRLGVSREMPRPEGGKLLLSGEIAGSPIYLQSHNFVAAMSVSADELWPTNVAVFSESTTGLNLTGSGQTLALWEVDGGVRTTHIELTGRAVQKDTATLDTTGHATAVAGTMAAGGNGTLFGSYAEARGVAYQANVFAYELLNSFKPERESAAAGNATNPPVFVSNHSWGARNGWTRETAIVAGTNVFNAWVWYGVTNATFQEDYKFGFYTPNLPDDTGCTQLDLFQQS